MRTAIKIFLTFSLTLSLLQTESVYGYIPQYKFTTSSPREYTLNAGDSINLNMNVLNYDEEQHWLEVSFGSTTVSSRSDRWVSYSKDGVPFTETHLDPQESENFIATVSVPDDACPGEYILFMHAELQNHEMASDPTSLPETSGATFGVAYGIRLYLTVNSSVNCSQPYERLVFYDKNGDAEYDPSSGEKLITEGIVRFYDPENTLLLETDLSETEGRYNIPAGTPDTPKDFYITLNLSRFNGSTLDKTWEGNLYINRTGNSQNHGNAYFLNNISSYSSITENIDIRSRNTDKSGDWNEGTITIGPDDKDQIISPSRWDKLVEGTTFLHADLDHDGRIDPDDKDQIISPLYWDFPN